MTSASSPQAAPGIGIDRRWSWAVLAAASLTVGYLALHGVRGVVDLMAASIAGLGLLAASVAAPRAAGDYLRRRMGGRRGTSIGLQLGEAPIRRLAPQLLGVLATSSLLIGSAALARIVPAEAAGHAVAVMAVAVNGVALIANLVPLPGLAGWTLLLVALQMSGVRPSRRVPLAATVGRVAAGMLGVSLIGIAFVEQQPLLLIASATIGWYGWTATAAMVLDDAAAWLLAGLRAGDLARPIVDHHREEELVDSAPEADNRLALVMGRSGVVGVLGPRQMRRAAARPATRAADLMVPLHAVDVVSATTAAEQLLAQIARFGFVLVWLDGELAGADERNLLERALAADIRRRANPDRASRSA